LLGAFALLFPLKGFSGHLAGSNVSGLRVFLPDLRSTGTSDCFERVERVEGVEGVERITIRLKKFALNPRRGGGFARDAARELTLEYLCSAYHHVAKAAAALPTWRRRDTVP
jgi:hypothetical protein